MRGLRLERYEIREELGHGGMSVVYRAHDRQLDRDVAVKVLHDFLARQPEARHRFHREAVAVAKLHHGGILEIFDYSGPDAEEAYIVTELIDGVTLRAFVEQVGGLAHPELAALIVAELGKALAHAHAFGVIHRDLKPENVMVTRNGQLKLMDFGIAQLSDGQRVTATGTLLGSPAHMAPEVIDGERSDARADIFSLGTILFWLSTGKLPFEAPSPSALFKRILAGEYDDPQMIEPKIGNGLASIIRRSLERDPEQRYQRVTDLVSDLEVELEAVGLEPAEIATRDFLVDPEAFVCRISPKLVAHLSAVGRQALKQKRLALAMDSFNRVLAIDPNHPEVRALAKDAGRRHGLKRHARRASLAVAVLVVMTAIGYGTGHVVYSGAGAASGKGTTPAPQIEAAPKPAVSPTAAIENPAPPQTSTIEPAETINGTRESGVQPIAARSPRDAGPRSPRQASATRPIIPIAPVAKTDTEPPGKVEPPASAQKVKTGSLAIRIGNSFADVYLDGEPIRRDFYSGTIALPPGRHTLRVAKPGYGAFRGRRFETRADGTVAEVLTDGTARAIVGELRFPIPRADAATFPEGWEPLTATTIP